MDAFSKNSLKLKPRPILFGNDCPIAKKLKLNHENGNYSHLYAAFNPDSNIHQQKKSLPIFQKRAELIELIRSHKTLIILGETGSGKSTQIPQYIYSAKLNNNSRIAITQPRRVAAVTVATRVAQEWGNGMNVGEVVGFTIRFEDITSHKTKIKFLTDGMLLREAMIDKLLMEYSVVILDEAHERTVHSDVLFAIVKNAQKTREIRNLAPLKILIMSATMDVEHFSKYFDCRVVYIEGRTFPVNVFYSVKPQDDYQEACVSTFFKIHSQAPPNYGVLIFLTGQEEIEACAHQIRLLSKDSRFEGPPVKVYTLYAAQSSSQQMSAFLPTSGGSRKVVISTNIAETSITITGIKYVIDSGMVKVRTFHPVTGLEVLKVQKISQEQAWQRTGRAGRESEGFCYRLYTKSQFELMRKTSVPEIQRTNLNSLVLQLLAMGIRATNFDFMDPPPKNSITAALQQLKQLGAVDSVDAQSLTPLGKKMSMFPLDPRFSKILLSAESFGCLEEALTVVAVVCSESFYVNPPSKMEMAQNARRRFSSPLGDHVTGMNVYREFYTLRHPHRKSWCHEHFVNLNSILYVREVREQLQDICEQNNVPLSSCGSNMDALRQCLLTGLAFNVAKLFKDRQYMTLDKKHLALIHPSSSIYGQQPAYVVYTEIVQTGKCYIKNLTTVEAEWVVRIMPEHANVTNGK